MIPKEIFNNIDMLINMADSPLNIDDLNLELINIKKEISSKHQAIEELKAIMNDARYFNAASELVDKNIEISLKNKITRLKKKIKELNASLEEIKEREKSFHKDVTSLENKLEANNNYIATLKEKVNNATSNSYYADLLKKEEKNLSELTKELEEKQKSYQDILNELELTTQAQNELKDKLKTEEARLNDITDNLSNPNAYIDEDLKLEDTEKLARLKSEVETLEKRKIELLTDANMIGADAKELIINNDLVGALNKIKELVTIVKAKPFMDITSSSILEEELDKKESYQKELAALIDNKDYENSSSDILTKRKDALKEILEKNKGSINTYQTEISSIDEYINNTLGVFITESEEELLKIEKSLTEYRNLLKDNNKSNHLKANLEKALTKKEKERDILNDILKNAQEEFLNLITNTNKIAALIEDLTNENSKLEEELNSLNKLSLYDVKTKDLIEEEKDKEKLKTVNDEIKALKKRQKYSKTPDEIYDEIDMNLATLKNDNVEKEEPIDSLEVESPIPYPPERLKVVDVIPIAPVNNSTAKGA